MKTVDVAADYKASTIFTFTKNDIIAIIGNHFSI